MSYGSCRKSHVFLLLSLFLLTPQLNLLFVAHPQTNEVSRQTQQSFPKSIERGRHDNDSIWNDLLLDITRIASTRLQEPQPFVGSFTSNRDQFFSNSVPNEQVTASILNDTYCSSIGTSAVSISCSLNHASNVLILVFTSINDAVNKNASVGSATVNGFTMTSQLNIGSSTTLKFYMFWFYASLAGNDPIVVNYSGASNNAESMFAASFAGTRNTVPFLNSLVSGSSSAGTSVTDNPPAGELGRSLIQCIALNSGATVTQRGSQTQIGQVNSAGSSIEVNYEDTGSSVAMTGSWTGSTGNASVAFALLPPNQIVTNSNPGAGGGADEVAVGNITNGTSATLTMTGVPINSVVIVGIGILNGQSQTVSSVTVGGHPAFQLVTVPNGTNVSTDLWYYYSESNTDTVVVTLSANANAVIVAATFASAKGLQLFEDTETATGYSGTASVNVAAGTPNRRIIMISSFGASGNPVGSQGFDLAYKNGNGIGIDLNILDSSAQNTLNTSGNSSSWAAIATGLLPNPINLDASCSETGLSMNNLSCSLNHTANVLITIWAGIYDGNNNGSGSVTSVTVGGNAATPENTGYCDKQLGFPTLCLSLFYYYSSVAESDLIAANYSNAGNNPESLAVASFTGMRATQPFFDSEQANSTPQDLPGIRCLGAPLDPGEINRMLISATEIDHNDVFSPTMTSAATNFDITQDSGSGNSIDLLGQTTTLSSSGITQSNWLTSGNAVCMTLAVLPANQVVVDGAVYAGPAGGQRVGGFNIHGNGSVIKTNLEPHDANILLLVGVSLLNTSGQTVLSVQVGAKKLTELTRLETISSGAGLSTDLWYEYDTYYGFESLTVTLSNVAEYTVTYIGLSNTACTPTVSCIESTNAATDSGSVASINISAGSTNRVMVAVTSYAEYGTIQLVQGFSLSGTKNSTGLTSDMNEFEQPSNQAYTLQYTAPSSSWTVVGIAVTPSTV